MPDSNTSRPSVGTEAAGKSLAGNHLKDTAAFDNLAAARRRIDAAKRSEPLQDGRRDPLGTITDAPASTSAVMEGLRALWRLADRADRPVVERIARRVREGGVA